MSNRRSWGGSSPRLAALFLAVVLPPAATLVWLGLQLVEQDRSLWAQRELEGRQAAAQAIVSSLNQSLADAERHLSQGEPPSGAVRFVVSPQGVEAHPATRILWLPTLPTMPAAEAAQFTQAETVEFQGGAERALAFYEEMARSSSPAIRAGALVRVARVHRRERRWQEALTAYRRLAEIGEIAIDGMQVDLLARRAVCAVLEESGRKEELNGEAAALAADLLAGRWTLDQPARVEIPRGLDLYRPIPEDNPLTAEKVALGKQLFNERLLSRDRSLSCASCHDPKRAFTDGRSVAVGVLGRRGDRNVPTLMNRVYGRSFFWDGRIPSLEEQVLQPILAATENGYDGGGGRRPTARHAWLPGTIPRGVSA